MIYDEPAVRQAMRFIQNHCLSGGMHLRFGNNVPPTPGFVSHINHYYRNFCRDAIEAFLTVGFVPYRLRRLDHGLCIPEVFPMVRLIRYGHNDILL